MPRSTWKRIAGLTVGVLPVLATGVVPEPPAAAQDAPEIQAELMDLLRSDGLTREELAGLYRSLALGELPGGFEPPACVEGEEMFTDVPASSLFCPWIEEMARRGFTTGCTATEFCPGGPVSRGQMARFMVSAVIDEAFHVVGGPGEPAFGDGGEGDCLWQNADVLPGLSPVGFYKDSDGIVHLSGVAMPVDGPGGDGLCDTPTADFSDHIIFELRADYHPEHLKIFSRGSDFDGVDLIFIAPVGGLFIDEVFIRGGSVGFLSGLVDASRTPLDGFQFRDFWDAELPDSWPLSEPREPAHVSLQALRDLLD